MEPNITRGVESAGEAVRTVAGLGGAGAADSPPHRPSRQDTSVMGPLTPGKINLEAREDQTGPFSGNQAEVSHYHLLGEQRVLKHILIFYIHKALLIKN